MPPYFCRNLVILVEWNLAEGPANLIIPVDSGIYTRMFPGMVFPGMGRNGIVVQWARSLVRSLESWVQFSDLSLFFLSLIMTTKCKEIGRAHV